MSYLHVSIYGFAAHSGSGVLPVPQAPAIEEWQIPIDLESNVSPPFPQGANFVMLKADTACCLAFGADPVAIPGVHPVDRGERVWYGIHPSHRIAVVENS